MKETPLSHTGAHTPDLGDSEKQKDCFLDPLKQPRVVAHADEWVESVGRFPQRWLQVAGMGLPGRNKLLLPTDGLGPLTRTMEQGTAGGDSVPWERKRVAKWREQPS